MWDLRLKGEGLGVLNIHPYYGYLRRMVTYGCSRFRTCGLA